MTVVMPNFVKRNGLITVVVQDICTLEVLMVAFTDRLGFLETLKTGYGVFYSTSPERIGRWKKGETSGSTQIVHRVKVDCDGDSVIYFVTQNGTGACHTGNQTCFSRSVTDLSTDNLGDLAVEIHEVCDGIVNGG